MSGKSEILGQSNNYGYFSSQLSENIDHILLSYVGYMDTIIDRSLLFKDSLLVIGLIYGYELETIEFKAEGHKSIDQGKLSLSIKRLSEVPVIRVEPGVL